MAQPTEHCHLAVGYSNLHNAHAVVCSFYRQKPRRQHLCIVERLLDYDVVAGADPGIRATTCFRDSSQSVLAIDHVLRISLRIHHNCGLHCFYCPPCCTRETRHDSPVSRLELYFRVATPGITAPLSPDHSGFWQCNPSCVLSALSSDGALSWPDDPLVRETWITS